MKNVQVRGGYVLHIGSLEGTLRVGDTLNVFVDQVSWQLPQSTVSRSAAADCLTVYLRPPSPNGYKYLTA